MIFYRANTLHVFVYFIVLFQFIIGYFKCQPFDGNIDKKKLSSPFTLLVTGYSILKSNLKKTFKINIILSDSAKVE